MALVAPALVAVVPPADAAVGTCSIFWKGTTSSTAWELAANWSLTNGGPNSTRLPNATDMVCRSSSPIRPDVVLASARTVAGINFGAGSVSLTGGTFTVGTIASGAFDSTINNIASNGWTLGGIAAVTLTGPGDPVTPVSLVLAGAGPVSIAAGSAFNVSSLTVNNGKTLTNNGTFTVSCGNVFLNLGAKLDNFGTITLPPSCPGSTPFLSDGNVNTRFSNRATGVINVAGSTFVDMSNIVWHNDGLVNVNVTDFYFQPSVADVGTYAIGAGSTLHQFGTLTVSPGTVTGAGQLRVSGGNLVGNGGSVPHLAFDGGTVTGSLGSPDGILTNATFNGSGTFTVPSGGHAEFGGTTFNDTYTLLNNGTLTSTCGFTSLNGTSKLDNFGTTDLTSNVGCGTSVSISGATAQVVNETGGVLNLSATSFVDLSGVNLRNNGQVNSSSADAYVNPAATDTGSYNIISGHLNNFGNMTVSPGTVTGAGLFQQNGGGTLTGAGGNIPHLNAASGTVTGNLSSDDVTLNGAQLTGPGRLTVNTGGTLANPFGVTLFGGYDIENHGAATLSTVGFADPNSILDNFGSLLLGSGSQIFDSSVDASGQLINRAAGTITATCTLTTQSVFLQRLSNSGTLETNKCDVTIAADSDLSGAGALTGSGSLKATTGQIRLDRSITSNASTLVLGATGTFFDSSVGTATALTTLASNTGTLVLNKALNTTTALTNSGTVNVQAATFRPNSYTQSAGSTVVVSGAVLRGGGLGTGAVQINGGNLTGGGSIQAPLTNAGVIQPGGGGTAMSVSGTYTQATGGTFGVTVTGPTTPGTDFSKLTATSSATLNGTLAITTSPTFDPAVGSTLRILDASSRTGTFSSVTGITLANNKHYDVVYDTTGVTLAVAADPQSSVASASVVEGNAGTSTVSVAVTLDQASSRQVTYDYTTVDQTATAGSDYVATSGTLTFAPGETSKLVSVTVNGDTTLEPDETLLVRLSNAVNGTILTNNGVVTITNDDTAPPPLTVTAVSPSTIGQGALARSLTVTGSQFSAGSTVSFSKTGFTIVTGSLLVVNASTITLRVNAAKTVTTGPMDVTVTTATGSATCVGCMTVTARPTVVSASPNSLGQGAKQREVTVTGGGFQPGAKVTIAGLTVVSTSYVSSTTVEALVSVAATKAPGALVIAVANPDGGRETCSCFSVVAGPKITAISPTSYARGTTVTVTITGSNFVPGAKVTGATGQVIDGVVVLSSTTIIADVSTSTTATLGTGKTFTVTNPAAGGYGVGTFVGVTITS